MADGWMITFNTGSHLVLIVMVGYLLYQQRRQETRTDGLEREVGYVRGKQNGMRS